MNKADKYYIENLKNIKDNGSWDENPRPKWKDGKPAHSKFITGIYEEYDISKNEFPIPTLRNTAIKTGIREIFWIYQKQSSSLKDARDIGVKWWDEWDIGNGTIGQVYGATVKRYNLMNNLLDGLKNEPFSRRHIIDLYQYKDLNSTEGLHPCAFQTLWSVRKVDDIYYLDLTLTQRSSDYIMANYINKTQYVAFQMMVANHLGYKLGYFKHFVQNLHIYDRHFKAVDEILSREPLDINPKITLKGNKDFYQYTIDDFKIENIEGINKLTDKLEIAV